MQPCLSGGRDVGGGRHTMLGRGRHRVSDLVIACRNAGATPDAYKATKGSCLTSRRREIGAPPARQGDRGTPTPACEHCGALSTRDVLNLFGPDQGENPQSPRDSEWWGQAKPSSPPHAGTERAAGNYAGRCADSPAVAFGDWPITFGGFDGRAQAIADLRSRLSDGADQAEPRASDANAHERSGREGLRCSPPTSGTRRSPQPRARPRWSSAW